LPLLSEVQQVIVEMTAIINTIIIAVMV